MKKVKLTQNQYALVDNSDYEELSKFKWYAKWDEKIKSFYAGRNVRNEDGKYCGQSIGMHRQILNPARNLLIDHVNHNTLDNRKSNLRLVSYAENQYNKRISKRNTSGYKGVSWYEPRKNWAAHIRKDGVLKHLGYFLDPIDAAYSYNMAAERLFGEYAFINKLT